MSNMKDSIDKLLFVDEEILKGANDKYDSIYQIMICLIF